MQLLPSDSLKPFIKNYSVIEISNDLNDEIFYPSGYLDFVVKLPNGKAATIINGQYKQTPNVELLGHLTVPTRLNAAKGTTILITRFYPYACSLFFYNPISEFTNYATDISNVYSGEIIDLYDKIMEAGITTQKIKVLDGFFIRKLSENQHKHKKVLMIAEFCRSMLKEAESINLNELAQTFGFSERYFQKTFLEVVGVSPVMLFSIYRFNKSLGLILSSADNLTSVAHRCGYYDQSHFIKEFKKFTGIKPFEAKSLLTKRDDQFHKSVNIGI
ncbi:MAG: helix-turn-helix domain-containing protein [Bacteroidota bacterium]